MKHILLAVATMIWVGAQVAQAGGLSPAGEREMAKPGVVVTDVLEVKATIEAIDYKNHMMTLKGTQGRMITLKADRAVRNFDQLKRGDVILVDFVESIAIFMRTSKTPQSPAEVRLVSVAPKGSKTGVLLAKTFQVTAVVESIDSKARQVTLREPNGSSWMVPVDKSFKNLDRFRKGEEVVAQITEAIAIKVEKRK
jgi:translation elongation factor P/translation initiation factor 5A